MHRVIEEIMRAYVNFRHNDWDSHLTAIEIAYNNSVNSVTGKSPFYLNYGFNINTPATLDLKQINNQAATDYISNLQEDLEAARRAMQIAQRRQAEYANQRRRHFKFSEGDEVMLSTENLAQQYGVRKFSARWSGPFKIIQKISATAYKLQLPNTWRIHPVFHVSLLKPAVFSDKYPHRGYPRPPPIHSSDVYTVEKLLDRKEVRHRGRIKYSYLVKWLGYPIWESTWEPEENLLGSDTLKMKQDLDSTNAQNSVPQT